MDLIRDHQQQRRAEGARGFWGSLIFFAGSAIAALILSSSPSTVTAVSESTPTPDPRVNVLEQRTADQEAELRELRRALLSTPSPLVEQPRTVYSPYATRSGDNAPDVVVVRRTNTVHTDAPDAEAKEDKSPKAKGTEPPADAVEKTTKMVKETVDGVSELLNQSTEALSK